MTPPVLRQLVYTNVEAPQSPTNQRGFQVWRYSRGLAADLRRIIEERVKDFRLPPGLGPDSDRVERHAGFSLPDGSYAVARTVPLDDRDRFGRGGRFLAHVAILSGEDFRRLDYDPFTVIDGGFRFFDRLTDCHAGGARPAAEFETDPRLSPAGRQQNENVPQEPPGFGDLLRHFTSPNPLPVVVAGPPADVLKLVRTCVRALPPTAFMRLAFDSLASAPLTAACPCLVGAFSTNALKLWPSKRYHLYDVATGRATPPFTPRPSEPPLAQRILNARGWKGLSRDSQQAVYDAALALDARRPDHLPASDLDPNGGAVLEAVDGRPALNQLIREKIAKEVTKPLATLPEVAKTLAEYFACELHTALSRLRGALPPDELNKGLLRALATEGAAPPDTAVLTALGHWLQSGGAGERMLPFVQSRWRLSPADLHKLEVALAGTDEVCERLRHWLPTTLKPKVLKANPLQLCEALEHHPTEFEYEPREVALRAALAPANDAAWWPVRLLVACHLSDTERLRKSLDRLRDDSAATEDWARVLAFTILAPGNRQLQWSEDENEWTFGIFCPNNGLFSDHRALLFGCADADWASTAVKALRERDGVAGANDVTSNVRQTARTDPVGKLCEKLLARSDSPDRDRRRYARDRDQLISELGGGTDAAFDWAVWQLRDWVRGIPCIKERESGWFLGLEVVCDRSSRGDPYTLQEGYKFLFRALAAVVARGPSGDKPPKPHRFWYLYDVLAADVRPYTP